MSNHIFVFMCNRPDRTRIILNNIGKYLDKYDEENTNVHLVLDKSNKDNHNYNVQQKMLEDWRRENKFIKRHIMSTNIGGPFIFSSLMNFEVFGSNKKFLIIEDDIVFSPSHIYHFFNRIEEVCCEDKPIICCYPIAKKFEQDSRMPIFWFWGGKAQYLNSLDIRNKRFTVNDFPLFIRKNFSLYLFYLLILIRIKYLRWYHWDYSLLFQFWKMNFIVEWYPLNGISNIGFNDQATNTSLHKIFFSKSSEPITDKNLCFSYIGVGNTSFLWKVYWLTRVLFKTVNKCFKVR